MNISIKNIFFVVLFFFCGSSLFSAGLLLETLYFNRIIDAEAAELKDLYHRVSNRDWIKEPFLPTQVTKGTLYTGRNAGSFLVVKPASGKASGLAYRFPLVTGKKGNLSLQRLSVNLAAFSSQATPISDPCTVNVAVKIFDNKDELVMSGNRKAVVLRSKAKVSTADVRFPNNKILLSNQNHYVEVSIVSAKATQRSFSVGVERVRLYGAEVDPAKYLSKSKDKEAVAPTVVVESTSALNVFVIILICVNLILVFLIIYVLYTRLIAGDVNAKPKFPHRDQKSPPKKSAKKPSRRSRKGPYKPKFKK